MSIHHKRKYIGEIGYFIDEKNWGKGIASKSVKLIEDLLVKKLNLTRVEIIMSVKNKGSEKVAIKSDYTKEEVMKDYLKYDGIYHDAYLYSKIFK